MGLSPRRHHVTHEGVADDRCSEESYSACEAFRFWREDSVERLLQRRTQCYQLTSATADGISLLSPWQEGMAQWSRTAPRLLDRSRGGVHEQLAAARLGAVVTSARKVPQKVIEGDSGGLEVKSQPETQETTEREETIKKAKKLGCNRHDRTRFLERATRRFCSLPNQTHYGRLAVESYEMTS